MARAGRLGAAGGPIVVPLLLLLVGSLTAAGCTAESIRHGCNAIAIPGDEVQPAAALSGRHLPADLREFDLIS